MTSALDETHTKERLDMSSVGIVIPTCNAGSDWTRLEQALSRQGVPPSHVLIVDSSSTDGTDSRAIAAGYRVIRIARSNFNHGGTRRFASEQLPWAEILIYLTQDAIPEADACLAELCQAFRDPKVAVAYGRQIARREADAIERHARLFNYPPEPSVRAIEDRERLGIKAAFVSNSFAAYRRSALQQIGGFPQHVIACEDQHAAARFLLAGWKVAYVAQATVVHSHDLSLREEFLRYFDTGVHHAREPWILENFGKVGGEGKRFVQSELRYLFSCEKASIPQAIVRTAIKLIAFNLGRREALLPFFLKRRLTSQPGFWRHAPTGTTGNNRSANGLQAARPAFCEHSGTQSRPMPDDASTV
jgi:rhamnosyltransferase